MIHTNQCAYCNRLFLTNAIATPLCPRCRRLLRAVRALDALRERLARPGIAVANLLYDVTHPAQVWADRKVART